MKYMVQTTIVKFVLHMFRTTTNSKGKKTLRKNILYPSTNLMKSKMTSLKSFLSDAVYFVVFLHLEIFQNNVKCKFYSEKGEI